MLSQRTDFAGLSLDRTTCMLPYQNSADPFDALPIPLTNEDHGLLMSAIALYSSSSILGTSPLWLQQGLVSWVCHTEMTLLNLLTMTCTYLSRLAGHTDTPTTRFWLWRRVKCHRQIVDSTDKRFSFESFAGIIGAIQLAQFDTDKDDSIHFQALVQLLRQRTQLDIKWEHETEERYVFSKLLNISQRLANSSEILPDERQEHREICARNLKSLWYSLQWEVTRHQNNYNEEKHMLHAMIAKPLYLPSQTTQRSQQLWLLCYLALIWMSDLQGAQLSTLIFNIFESCRTLNVDIEFLSIQDLIGVVYQSSFATKLIVWEALSMLRGLQTLSDEDVSKVGAFLRMVLINDQSPVSEDAIQNVVQQLSS